ncbi:unnamed protein product, partial [Symbiodinium sp. KB8]
MQAEGWTTVEEAEDTEQMLMKSGMLQTVSAPRVLSGKDSETKEGVEEEDEGISDDDNEAPEDATMEEEIESEDEIDGDEEEDDGDGDESEDEDAQAEDVVMEGAEDVEGLTSSGWVHLGKVDESSLESSLLQSGMFEVVDMSQVQVGAQGEQEEDAEEEAEEEETVEKGSQKKKGKKKRDRKQHQKKLQKKKGPTMRTEVKKEYVAPLGNWKRQTFLFSATLGQTSPQAAKSAAKALLEAEEQAVAQARQDASDAGLSQLPQKLGKAARRKLV